MLSEELKRKALELGFDLVGIAAAGDPQLGPALERYLTWLDAGNAAGMEYLRRHADQKAHPERLLEGVRSVVCVGLLYGEEPSPEDATRARVSLYTRGCDYHELMGQHLRELGAWLQERGVRSRPFVDAEPVLERFWAWRAGLGWIGKNSMLINRKRGSLFFLGGLLVAEELATDEPGLDHCGRCRKCIDACPTFAITNDRAVDARKCIGYHTIENKGGVPPEVMQGTGRWIAGCDICQTICPWNDPVTRGHAFNEINPAYDADLRELARWRGDDFKTRVGKKIAMGRMKFSGFVRNVAIAVANSGLGLEEKRAAIDALEETVATLPEGAGRDGAVSALEWARERLSS